MKYRKPFVVFILFAITSFLAIVIISTHSHYPPIMNSLGMKFVYIPPGEFMMGSPADDAERSFHEVQHRVRFTKGFYLCTTEVTQSQWVNIMGTENNFSRFKGNDLPVEHISWSSASDFCRKISRKENKLYRLPTEAEWEYASRAGTRTKYGTGNSKSDLMKTGWYYSNSDNVTHPVGQKAPNDWGLYDMHGNVWEWCSDWFDEYNVSKAVSIDPQGSPKGWARILRSGAYCNNTDDVRSAARHWNEPKAPMSSCGLRVVIDIESINTESHTP